jgi:hypothetical protein
LNGRATKIHLEIGSIGNESIGGPCGSSHGTFGGRS